MRNEGRRSVGVELSRRNGLGDWTPQGEMRPQLPQGLKSMRASFINAQANLEDAKNVPQWLELNYCGRASEVQRLSRRVGDEEIDVAYLAAEHPGNELRIVESVGPKRNHPAKRKTSDLCLR